MLNMKKLRKNVLPGVILAMVLVGGNLAFGFSGETISGAQNTQQQAQKDGDSSGQGDVADQEGNQDQTGVNSSDETGENSDGQNPDPDNSGGGYSDTDNNGTPGDDTTNKTVINTSSLTLRGSGGSTFEIERVLYSDYSVEYRGYDGVGYTDNGNESYTDDYGNTYPALNDSTHYLGTTLEQHTLTSSDGNTVTVTQTTNGDYYYRDDNGTGFSDNGDGTWTDENGNTYTE